MEIILKFSLYKILGNLFLVIYIFFELKIEILQSQKLQKKYQLLHNQRQKFLYLYEIEILIKLLEPLMYLNDFDIKKKFLFIIDFILHAKYYLSK